MALKRLEPAYLPARTPRGLQALAIENPYDDTMREVEAFAQRATVAAAETSAKNKVFSGENPSPSLGLSAAGQAYNEAAAQATQSRTAMDLRAKAAELQSKYSGRNLTDPETASRLFDAHVNEVVGGIDERFRPEVEFEAQARKGLLVSNIRHRANEYEFARNKEDIFEGIRQDSEEAMALARFGGAPEDIALIEGRANDKLEKAIELGMISPDDAARRIEEYRGEVEVESIFGQAYRGGTVASTYKGVMNGSVGKEMTLKQRDRLASRLSTEIGRQHSAASHARAALAADTKANSAVAARIADKVAGNVRLTPEEADLRDRIASNEAPVTADAYEKLATAERSSWLGARIYAGPAAQGQSLAADVEEAAEDGTSLITADVAKKGRELADKHAAALSGSDPVPYLMEIGALDYENDPPKAIDFSSLESINETARDRRARLDVAEQKYRQSFQLMTGTEIAQLKTRLDGAEPEERLAILGTLAHVEGRRRGGQTLEELDKAGARNYALVGHFALEGQPGLAAEMAGAATMETKQKDEKFVLEGGGTRTERADFGLEVGGMYVNDPAAAAVHLEAAQELYAVRAWRNGWTAYKPEEFRKVVHETVGGIEVVTTGSTWGLGGTPSKIPVVRGPNRQPISIQGKIDNLTGAEIAEMGGTNLDNKKNPEFVAELIRQSGKIVMEEDGIHVFIQGNRGELRELVDNDGNPFLLHRTEAGD